MPSVRIGSGELVTAAVVCDGTAALAVLDESADSVLGSRNVSLVGDVGLVTSRTPPVESFVFFFLRRFPKVGIGAERCGLGWTK